MGPEVRSDEDLLSARDGATFELFYRRHAERMLGYFVRRTHDAELAADLTAETFAAALVGRRRYRPDAGHASAWLFGIACNKLVDAQRRGYAERRAQRRLGMERIELTDDDIERIEPRWRRGAARCWSGSSPSSATRSQAHVIEERDVRRDRPRPATSPRRSCASASAAASPPCASGWEQTMTDDFVTRLGVALRDAAIARSAAASVARAGHRAPALPRLRLSPVVATLLAGLVLAAA